ncbi:MAG: hypothetical protein ACYC0V_21105 [Armatimonadota bacterium]
MDENVSISELQIASDFIKMKRHLMFIGITSIMFGLILLSIAGLLAPQSGKLIIMIAIGVLFTAVGILSIAKPSPVMILIAFLPWVGIIVSSIILEKDLISKIVRCMTLLCLITMMNFYLGFRRKVLRKPTPEAMAIMDPATEAVEMRDISASDYILEMNWGTMKWRVYLSEHLSVLFGPDKSPISVLDRDQDLFAPRSRTGDTQMVGVTNEAKREIYLHISDEHYQRYLAWKEHRVKQEGILT